MQIPEPEGPVCLTCRCDEAGIVWEARTYDRYIAHPDLWRAAGWSLHADAEPLVGGTEFGPQAHLQDVL